MNAHKAVSINHKSNMDLNAYKHIISAKLSMKTFKLSGIKKFLRVNLLKFKVKLH